MPCAIFALGLIVGLVDDLTMDCILALATASAGSFFDSKGLGNVGSVRVARAESCPVAGADAVTTVAEVDAIAGAIG